MRKIFGIMMTGALLLAVSFGNAQGPDNKGFGKKGGKGDSGSSDPDAAVERMFKAFDKNNDGKLTRDEITDERLISLFERADTNKEGFVTKEKLKALFVKEAAEYGSKGGGFFGGGKGGGPDDKGGFGGGPGGPGGPGGGGQGGRGGPGGPGGRGFSQPGQVLSTNVQDQLKLNDSQKKQVAEIQKDVDSKLEKILTDEQKTQLKEMRDRGPGGPGGPGGRGGPGGPGGGPGGPGGPPPE
jgi:hypothetical protein